ncbi:hypothetical protein P1P91_12280 [Halomonas piscis]|uniref:DUF3108 domain-containing protein n=1 Tax=Halomonas piscis TaxID=3031727 RepID=A0ABY9YXQ8_9GAMM|nr:hypothetical protein [Halomonas piscis]WNK19606.1 hypothetical protein P1P91_12280 [Halomonas piscis]
MPIISRALPAAALALGIVAGLIGPAFAESPALRPVEAFEAQYRLKVDGWPGATLSHVMSQEGRHWKSAMRFSIAVASGRERSRFIADDEGTHSLHYYSGYSLFGVGDSYELADADIDTLDRQTALVDLARRAGRETCSQASPCDVHFVDHRGRDEDFQYYADGTRTIKVPAGRFDAQSVVLLDADKPDREIRINYHPDYPGLIVDASYWKDGERETHIALTRLKRP